MEKRGVLRASTPGGHPLIAAAWLGAALVALSVPVGLAPAWLPIPLALGGLAAYLARHRAFLAELARAEAALDRGDVANAKGIVGPLFDRFPELLPVQKAAAATLYAGGDPLSAAALYERVTARDRDDTEAIVGLVASYAALNKVGDARRAAACALASPDVRLALAWAELAALGADRLRGVALTRELFGELDAHAGAERNAMITALVAIAAATEGDRVGASAAIDRLPRLVEPLVANDAAFIGYLEGIALRDAGAPREARRAFERAMERAPGSIGEALARRERAHLVPEESTQASESGSSSAQPSSD